MLWNDTFMEVVSNVEKVHVETTYSENDHSRFQDHFFKSSGQFWKNELTFVGPDSGGSISFLISSEGQNVK